MVEIQGLDPGLCCFCKEIACVSLSMHELRLIFLARHIYLSSPHMSGREKEFVEDAFVSNWVAPLGPHVDAFEREVSEYVGVRAGAALSSGTAAIHLALVLLGVGQGDVVFCSSLTFAASCNPILYQKAIPVLIDSEPDSFNMSPVALERAFRDYRPKAVIVVDLYGQSADMDPIKELCDRYDAPIIEDAAESLGATYKGKQSGSFGKFGVFSFNGNKIITTSGGGMLVSDDEEAIKKARFLATQARDEARHYQHSELGYNYRLSNVSAAIGRGQLTVLGERIQQKKHIYSTYKDAFSDIEAIEMAPVSDYGESNYWLSVITIDSSCRVKPLDVMMALEKESIESRPVWKPMHLQPLYKGYPFYSHYDTEVSVAEDVFNRGLCLPSDTKMTDEDLERVVGVVRGVFGEK